MRSSLLAVFVLSFVLCGSLRAQDDSERAFAQIHEYLKGDIRARTFSSPLLFVGEIVALGPVFQGVCKQAVNQTVDFRVSELLLGDLSGETFQNAYPNCTRQPLPSPPFALLASVILYCHHHHFSLQPVPGHAGACEHTSGMARRGDAARRRSGFRAAEKSHQESDTTAGKP